MTQTPIRLTLALLPAGAAAFAQRAPIPQQLTFTPYRAGGIYDVGETVGWTVTPGPVTPTYAYKWAIRRNNAVVLKEGKLDLSSGHDNLAPQKGRACPERTREILGLLVKGGEFNPNGIMP